MKRLSYYILLLVIIASCASKKNVTSDNDRKQPTENNESELKAYFIEANKQKIIGNISEAIGLFLKVVELDPKNAASHYELSGLYDVKEMYTRSLSHSEKAAEINPKNDWYLSQLGFLYKKHSLYKKAANVFEKLASSQPKKVEFAYHQATCLIYSNELDKAIKVYQDIQEKEGVNEENVLRMYSLYLELKKKDKALGEIEKLQNKFGDDPYYLGIAGEAYEKAGEEIKALEIYEKLAKKDPNNGKVQMSLYSYYSRKGNEEKAFHHIKKAFQSTSLNIDDKMKVMLDYYGMTEVNLKYIDQAYELAEIMTVVHPDNPKSYSIYSDFLYRDNKLKEAQVNLKKALDLDDTKYPIWDQYLRVGYQLEDYELVERESDQAIELFPLQPALFLYKGLSSKKLNSFEESISSLTAGKDLVIDNDKLLIEFYQNLAEAHHKNEDYEKSDMFYDKALKIEPYNVYILNNFSYYLSLRREKLDQAAEMSKKSNELLPGQPSFLDTYGWILFVKEEYQAAEKHLLDAINNGGQSNATILEHYGDALYKVGKVEDAVNNWKKAKELGSTSEKIDQKITGKKYIE